MGNKLVYHIVKKPVTKCVLLTMREMRAKFDVWNTSQRRGKESIQTMKNIAAIIALALIIPAFNSCIFDAKQAPPTKEKKAPPFRDLTERDDVFFNLQLAYNQMNIDEYNKLLDDKFIFNFSPADLVGDPPNVDVAQWDRAAEIDATRNIFNLGVLPPGVDPVSDITLELFFTDSRVDTTEGDDWQPVAPPDPQKYPGEVWYFQRIDYFLSVVAGENTFTSGGPLKTEYTIRQVDDNGTMIWRIISWRDLGEF